MYKAIASVGTLLLKLGEFTSDKSREEPVLTEENGDNSPKLSEHNDFSKQRKCSPKSPRLLKISGKLNDFNIGRMFVQDPDNVSCASDSSSGRLRDALADAAASIGSPSTSHDGSANGDDFIRVGSEEGLSSPEIIELEDDSKGVVTNEISQCLPRTSERYTTTSYSINESGDVDETTLKPEKRPETADESPLKSHEGTSAISEERGQSSKVDPKGTIERRPSGAVDPSWLITFEQFLASILTEPLLVQYFEEETDIEDVINTVKTEGVRNFVKDPRRSFSVE